MLARFCDVKGLSRVKKGDVVRGGGSRIPRNFQQISSALFYVTYLACLAHHKGGLTVARWSFAVKEHHLPTPIFVIGTNQQTSSATTSASQQVRNGGLQPVKAARQHSYKELQLSAVIYHQLLPRALADQQLPAESLPHPYFRTCSLLFSDRTRYLDFSYSSCSITYANGVFRRIGSLPLTSTMSPSTMVGRLNLPTTPDKELTYYAL